MPELKQLDITIVSLVGKAANKRKLLVVKNESGRKETPVTQPNATAAVVPPAPAAALAPATVVKQADPVEPSCPHLTAVMKSVAQTRSAVQWLASAIQIAKASRNDKPTMRDHGRFKKVSA